MDLRMRIRDLTSDDLAEVAKIHLEELPDDFCSLLGKDFATNLFYPELFEVSDVALCVADDGGLRGFVFFSSDKGFLRRLATRHFFQMVRYSLPHVFEIKFLRYLFEVFILIFASDDRLCGAELAYIAVSGAHQGRGLGSELTKRGLSDLGEVGIHTCWVKTLASTPESVRFYEKVGFKLLKTHLGRAYLTICIDTVGE